MRKHMIVPGVGQRDSAYFSVIDEEWPVVRAALQERFILIVPVIGVDDLFGHRTFFAGLVGSLTASSSRG